MSIFEWDDSIALGIRTIDEQHRALFGWINVLNDAINSGDAAEAVGEVIWKLITYVTEHFSQEERLMLAWNYPRLASHRMEHDEFVKRLQDIQVSFIDRHEMGKGVLDLMANWLVCHIKGTDQDYNRFIQQQETKGLTSAPLSD
jgi:hemerythrin-like metal-binding protein